MMFESHVFNPEKYGMIGSYSREFLEVSEEADRAFAFDQMLVRFTTQILTGKTVSETQEVSAQVPVPATWWDALMDMLNRRLHLYIPVLWKTVTAKATVKWDRRLTYPEADITVPPDQFGRPVAWESVELTEYEPGITLTGTSLSRFANRYEVARAVWDETPPSRFGNAEPTAELVLDWLSKHGVNPDQLVAKSAIR